MKKTFALVALLFVANSGSAKAATLVCEGSVQASDFDTAISVVADIVSDTKLANVHFQQLDTGANEVVTEAHLAQVDADEDYTPRLEKYKNMNRYLLQTERYHEGNIYLLLPEVLEGRVRVKAYLYWRAGGETLNCRIK